MLHLRKNYKQRGAIKYRMVYCTTAYFKTLISTIVSVMYKLNFCMK